MSKARNAANEWFSRWRSRMMQPSFNGLREQPAEIEAFNAGVKWCIEQAKINQLDRIDRQIYRCESTPMVRLKDLKNLIKD